MKTLNLKQADDKTFCLFVWDSSKKAFTQIASGRIARKLSEGNWFLMGNDSTDLAVYHLFDNDVRVFPVHVENAEIINGICVYERNGLWYCFVGIKEVLLGEKRSLPLSTGEVCRLSEKAFHYFVLGEDTKDFVLTLIINSVLVQGKYAGELRAKAKDYLFARREDGNYDIIKAGTFCFYDEDKPESGFSYIYDDIKRVYFWDEAKSSWKILADDSGCVLAKNALKVRCANLGRNESCHILYEVCGVELKEAARGSFKRSLNGDSFQIGELIFSINRNTFRVDFEHPRLTLKHKVKKFFKM